MVNVKVIPVSTMAHVLKATMVSNVTAVGQHSKALSVQMVCTL